MQHSVVARDGAIVPLNNPANTPFTHVVLVTFPALPATVIWPAEPEKRVGFFANSGSEATDIERRRRKASRVTDVEIIELSGRC